jgi:pimeloyl-ACP methyl ester carboxylesterase
VFLQTIGAIALSFLGKASTIHSKRINIDSIFEFRKVLLGGLYQSILIRSQNKNNSIVLFVHGGPGSPELPQFVNLSRRIEDQYTVVIWDQRGCGKSYIRNIKSLSKEQIVSDAIELVQYLKLTFNKEKVIIVGHSWGTIISLDVIKKIPNDILAYISIGQVVDFKRNEEISYMHLLQLVKDRGDSKSLKILEEIGPPINGLYRNNIVALMKQRAILLKHGCVYFGRDNALNIVKMIVSAPEYTLKEKYLYSRGQMASLNQIWNEELMETNFIKSLPTINVPVLFVIGEVDYNTPKELVIEYYEKLNAPIKKITIFEKSGHDPHVEKPEDLVREMFDFLGNVNKLSSNTEHSIGNATF